MKIKIFRKLLFISATLLTIAGCEKGELPIPDKKPVKEFNTGIGTHDDNVDFNYDYVHQQISDEVQTHEIE
ncbi:MAG: hypothetical protein H7Y00_01420 [Fimbriimonadaceae bacterium]|nr:hypothetical protein [Chitinophagales bacterium]